MTTTAEEDRQFRRSIKRTLADQKAERTSRLRRQSVIRAPRLRQIESEDRQEKMTGGSPARAIEAHFDVQQTIAAAWGRKQIRHKLRQIEFVGTGDEGALEPPDGLQSVSADDLSKGAGSTRTRLVIARRRDDEILDEDTQSST